MSEARKGLSLAARIFLGTGLILVAALGAAVFAVSTLGERIAARSARDRISASSSVQTAAQQQRFQQLGLLAQVMAGNPDFKAYVLDAMGLGDRASILDQLEERRADLGYDLAIVTDPNGIVAARTDQPEVAGADLSSRPLVRKVRAEFEASGIWQDGSRLYEAVATPMAIEGIFGYLVLGYQVSDLRALEVKRGTGSEVLFLAGQQAEPVASSLTPQETERALGAVRRQGDLLTRATVRGENAVQAEIELDSERWLALLSPLPDAEGKPVGAVVSLASLDRELAAFREIRNLLVIVGLAALVAALALAYALSRRTSGPLQSLVRAVGAAREGNYDVTLPGGGSGEVVALANNFNSLLADLRERREMAEYVAKLSRNLPDVGPGGAPGGAEGRAEQQKVTVLAAELRRYLKPRTGTEPQALLERMTRDLRKISSCVTAHGGRLADVSGHRALATFGGERRAERALAAAADVLAAVGTRENAFDDAEPPAVGLASGEICSGPVAWGAGTGRVVMGVPVQQLEGLLREAGAGEILMSSGVHAEVDASLSRAGVTLEPQRGLMSTQTIYMLDAAGAGKLGGAPAPAAGGEDAGAMATLSGIGPGSLMGSRFEILSILGTGGMGVVYKARDRELDDLVALKMIKREVAGDRALVERLKSELKLARKITHPNVLRTFDFGEIDGVPFISMEYVRGITMRAMLEQSGRPPYSAGMRLARQLLAGLAAAHQLEIIHRDIKPENALLDPLGNVKLMDFGLARPVQRLEPGQTQAGWIVGTPHYLAPEQIEGKEADPRADVYACGVLLYEIFTGRLPYESENQMEILLKHLKEPPTAPSLYWVDIPRPLEQLILRCLERDAADRPQSAQVLLRDLERLAA
jgi:serine/threonine-protein kinase